MPAVQQACEHWTYALMPTREEALAELGRVFEIIAAECHSSINSSSTPPVDAGCTNI